MKQVTEGIGQVKRVEIYREVHMNHWGRIRQSLLPSTGLYQHKEDIYQRPDNPNLSSNDQTFT